MAKRLQLDCFKLHESVAKKENFGLLMKSINH